MSHLSVIGLIAAAGLLGGSISFALSRTEDSTWQDFLWSALVGLGASALVPLFLNTISSSLLSGILGGSAGQADIYVFFGFCLLGAIASKAMIQTLTQKLLREMEEARKEVKTLKADIAPIVAKETEPPKEPQRAFFEVKAFGNVDPDTKRVIEALGYEKYTWRYLGGISEQTGLSDETILKALDWLVANGLASEKQGKRGKLWGLSTEGRNLLSAI